MLFSVRISSGFLILYDYLASPHLISRGQAYDIAIESRKPYPDFSINRTVNMYLVHSKSDGMSYVVNEKTLKDEILSYSIISV